MAGNTHANSYVSPKFIKAKSPEELEKLMLANNIKTNRQHHYSIMVKGQFFYAWYDHDYKGSVKIKVRGA